MDKGEVTYEVFEDFTGWLRGHLYSLAEAFGCKDDLNQAARRISDAVYLFNFLDVSSIREGLMDSSLNRKFEEFFADFHRVITPRNGKFLSSWQGLLLSRWDSFRSVDLRREYLKERLGRLRKEKRDNGEPKEEIERIIDSLSPQAISVFFNNIRYLQGWYVESATFGLMAEIQLKVIALALAIAGKKGLDMEKPFHINFFKLMRLLSGSRHEFDSYKTRILEVILKDISLEDILLNPLTIEPFDWESASTQKKQLLGAVSMVIDGQKAISFDFSFSDEANKLLELIYMYEQSSLLRHQQTLNMLLDILGLRRDQFDRVGSQDTYMKAMASSRDDKSRLLNYGKGPVWVDIGPADGPTLEIAQKLSHDKGIKRILAIEISHEAIKALNKKKVEHKLSLVTAVKGDVYDLRELLKREGVESADTIVFSSVLHEIYSYSFKDGRRFNLDSVSDVLTEALLALAPGGRLLIRDGVIPENGEEEQILELRGETNKEVFDYFVRHFPGRDLKAAYRIIDEDSQNQLWKIIIKRKDAMEFLFKLTWCYRPEFNPCTFWDEVKEQYGVLTRKWCLGLLYKIANRYCIDIKEIPLLKEEQSYLQPGYVNNLKGRARLLDLEGNEVDFPDSNMMTVMEKTGSKTAAQDISESGLKELHENTITGLNPLIRKSLSSPMVFAKLAMGDDVSIQEQERIINAVVEDIKGGRLKSESLTKELLSTIKGIIKESSPSKEAAGIFIRILDAEPLVKIKLNNFKLNKIEEKYASVKIEVLDLKDELGFKRSDELAMPLFAVAYLSLEPSADLCLRIFLTRAFARENIGSPKIITQAIMHVLNKFLGRVNLQAVLEEARYNLKGRNITFSTLGRWIIWYAAETRRYDYLLGLLKPWNEEESQSIRALRTNNSVTEEHIKALTAQAKELSYRTAREAAIALLATSEPEYLLRMSRIYSLGHDGFHTSDDRMNILAVIKILNNTYDNLQAYLGSAGNRPMPNISIYAVPIIFNALGRKEYLVSEDMLFKILEFIYSFEQEVTYLIPDFNKEVILGSLRIAAMSNDSKTQDTACKLFHLLNQKWNPSSSPLENMMLFPMDYLPLDKSSCLALLPMASSSPLEEGILATVNDLLDAQEAFRGSQYGKVYTYDYRIPVAPYQGDYILACGQYALCEYLKNFKVINEDIALLCSTGLFDADFLDYLGRMSFIGRVWMKPEGSLARADEPVIRIEAPKIQLEVIKTAVKNILGFQSLIATKSSRIIRASRGRPVAEFGLRRAQGEAGLLASRSAFIAGAVSTSNVYAGKALGIPLSGTMAHSYVMSNPSELAAFRSFAWAYQDKKPVLLIDTYNTIEGSGKALIVADELSAKGKRLFAVRIDSGDLCSDAKAVRRIFDTAGYDGAKRHKILILASGDLDEDKIDELIEQEAPIDGFGVGTNMVTGGEQSILEGVFSRSALKDAEGLEEVDLKHLRPQGPGDLFKIREYALSQMSDKLDGFIRPAVSVSRPANENLIARSQGDALKTDLYQLLMLQAYFKEGRFQEPAVFDYIYRKAPEGSDCVLSLGQDKALEYLENLNPSQGDIEYLASLGLFEADFLAYFKDFRFTGDVWALPEGSAAFPNEPILSIHAALPIAQYVETRILNIMNFQSLIATEVSRASFVLKGVAFIENALAWAQGPANIEVSRSAFIAGAVGTTNIRSARILGIPLEAPHKDLITPVDNITANANFPAYFSLGPQIACGGKTSALGGVYKLSQVNGRPVIKKSGTKEKTTLPGKRMIYRVVNEYGWLTRVIQALEGECIQGMINKGEQVFSPRVHAFSRDKRIYPKEGLLLIKERAKKEILGLYYSSLAFADIDTQKGFMYINGGLYVPGAEEITDNLRLLTGNARRKGIPIISTCDTHVDGDPEFNIYSPHCVKGTESWEKIPETLTHGYNQQIFIEKNTLDAFDNPEVVKIFGFYEQVVVYGVATEICVLKACLRLVKLGKEVYLVSDAIKAADQKAGEKALKELTGLGVRLVTTADVLSNRIKRRFIRRKIRVELSVGLKDLQDKLIHELDIGVNSSEGASSCAAGKVVVLDAARKNMVQLPVVKADRLRRQAKLSAARNLEEWLLYDGNIHAEHIQMIIDYMDFLKDSAKGPEGLYFVFSLDGNSLEGWLDLNVAAANGMDEYAVMEIAPWNRVIPRERRRYLGLGHELRVFGIKKLLGMDPLLSSEVIRNKIVTLGHRDADWDVFWYDVSLFSVREYLGEQEAARAKYIADYGMPRDSENKVSSSIDIDEANKEFDGALAKLNKSSSVLSGASSSLDREVGFFDNLGRISFNAGVNPKKIGLIKAGLEKILEVMPKNIIEDLKLNISAGRAGLKVIYDETLIESGLFKDNNGICLNIGRDILPENLDGFDFLSLCDLMSEGITSLMFSDYDELKSSSRTNENAYFKIELIKTLLNHKAYLAIYHKALHRHVRDPEHYWHRKTDKERHRLINKYLRELSLATRGISGVCQGDIFFNIMDDNEPMLMVARYIHILLKNPSFNEDVIYDIISDIRGIKVLNMVSIARLRNMLKELFFNGNVRMPARGNAFDDRYFFNNFDDTEYVSWLKDILLIAKDKNAFYSGLGQLIRYFLPLPERDLDGEIKALFKEDDDRFFSSRREEALKKAIGDILIRRLGENALRGIMKFLSGDRSLAVAPYIDILPIALNKGDNADNYESLRGLPAGDINYDFIFGRENRGAVDWVERLFLVLPKTNASDDGYINSGSPLLERGNDAAGSPVGPVKTKPLQDKYRKARNLLTNGSFLNSREIFECMLDELKRAEKYGKLGLTAITLKCKVENGLREIEENEKREGLKRQVEREHLKKKLNRKGKNPQKKVSDVRGAHKHLNVDISDLGSSPVILRNTSKECLLINYNYNEGYSNISSITASSASSYIERLENV